MRFENPSVLPEKMMVWRNKNNLPLCLYFKDFYCLLATDNPAVADGVTMSLYSQGLTDFNAHIVEADSIKEEAAFMNCQHIAYFDSDESKAHEAALVSVM